MINIKPNYIIYSDLHQQDTNHTIIVSGTTTKDIKLNTNEQTSPLISKNQINTEIFQIAHKKELIYNQTNLPLIKCIYCGNKYCNLRGFETHIRIHVSIYIYNHCLIL